MNACYHYDAFGNASTEWMAEMEAMRVDERTAELAQALVNVVNRAKRLELSRTLVHQVQWFVDALTMGDETASRRALDQVAETVRQLEVVK